MRFFEHLRDLPGPLRLPDLPAYLRSLGYADVLALSRTLQDLASLRELERLQAEFLSMVSHELRAPLTSIKGSTATVLRASRVLDPAEVRQFFASSTRRPTTWTASSATSSTRGASTRARCRSTPRRRRSPPWSTGPGPPS